MFNFNLPTDVNDSVGRISSLRVETIIYLFYVATITLCHVIMNMFRIFKFLLYLNTTCKSEILQFVSQT